MRHMTCFGNLPCKRNYIKSGQKHGYILIEYKYINFKREVQNCSFCSDFRANFTKRLMSFTEKRQT